MKKNIILNGLITGFVLSMMFMISPKADVNVDCNSKAYPQRNEIETICDFYEDDPSHTGFLLGVDSVDDHNNYEVYGSANTDLDNYYACFWDDETNSYPELIIVYPNRDVNNPIARIKVVHARDLKIKTPMSTKLTDETFYEYHNDIIFSNVEQVLFFNGNVLINSAFKDNEVSNDSDSIDVYFKVGLIRKTSTTLWPTGITGKIVSDYPITEATLVNENCSDCSNNPGQITFNSSTGEFEINLNNTDSELNVNATVLKVKLDVSNYDIDNNTVIDTSLTDLQFDTNSSDGYIQDVYNTIYNETTLLDAGVNGDWTGDSVFDLVDLVRYRLYIAGISKYTSEYNNFGSIRKSIVDLNSDGIVNTSDLAAARRLLIGLSIEE